MCLIVTFVSPAKTTEPIEIPFGGWVRWAQGTIIRWGGYQSIKGKVQFVLGHWRPIVKYRDTLPWAVQNGWTDRDAVWIKDLDRPKEPSFRWVPDPNGKGYFLECFPTFIGCKRLNVRFVCGGDATSSNYFDHLLLLLDLLWQKLTAAKAPVPMEKPVTALDNSEGFRGSVTTSPTNVRLNVRTASMTIAIPSVTPGPGTTADMFVSVGVSLQHIDVDIKS